MSTVNVRLAADLVEFVEAEVSLGHYDSPNAVVDDALRALKEDREADAAKLDVLRREIAIGLAEIERGEISTRSVAEIFQSVLDEDIE